MHSGGKVIVFLGPPGSGKGTQASRLSSALGIPAISTGEMLRRECHSGSPLGEAVQSVLSSGQLVSDDLINQVVASRLSQCDCERGCILDGYPRTLAQARFLDLLLEKLHMPQPVVFDFDIRHDEVVARLSRRRQCAGCGQVFSFAADPKASQVFCDRDGTPLIQRPDDDPTIIRERLRLYKKNAGELVRYYAGKQYHRISATRMPDDISDAILCMLEPHVPAGILRGRAQGAGLPIYPA